MLNSLNDYFIEYFHNQCGFLHHKLIYYNDTLKRPRVVVSYSYKAQLSLVKYESKIYDCQV